MHRLATQLDPQKASNVSAVQDTVLHLPNNSLMSSKSLYTGTPPPWQTAQLKGPACKLHTALFPTLCHNMRPTVAARLIIPCRTKSAALARLAKLI